MLHQFIELLANRELILRDLMRSDDTREHTCCPPAGSAAGGLYSRPLSFFCLTGHICSHVLQLSAPPAVTTRAHLFRPAWRSQTHLGGRGVVKHAALRAFGSCVIQRQLVGADYVLTLT